MTGPGGQFRGTPETALQTRYSRREFGRQLAALTLGGLAGTALSGCVTVPISAENPVPGLTTVAVAPFFNLSAERTVDGRRFAMAYHSELQKTPGFQVIPVGVVEQALADGQVNLSNPAEAVRLASVLGADAVVVGAVTQYDPYYPPQLGLQVQWYSPRSWRFFPGVTPDGSSCPAAVGAQPTIRAQSPDRNQRDDFLPVPGPSRQLVSPRLQHQQSWPVDPLLAAPEETPEEPPHSDRAEPLMSYTRFFDGADPKLIQSLKNYVAYRADQRSGKWEAYLHRSEDFIRFTAHLMILEMLSLHGAAVHSEYVMPLWK